jgi:tetratricopeptide (TPR) repeat protein
MASSIDTCPDSSWVSPEIRISIGLVVVTLVVLWPVLRNDFVSYDDGLYVTQNPQVLRGLTPENVRWAWSARIGMWHPLTWLSLQLDAELFGKKPWAFHGTNLLLHTVNVLVLFWALRRTSGDVWRSALVALLFAVHPLNVESVAWVAERKGLLSTFFGFLALLAYSAYVARPGIKRYLWVAGLMVLSLLAKPTMVTLPLLLLLLDYWPLGRFSWGTALREKLPLVALVILFCVVAIEAQQNVGALPSLDMVSLEARLAHLPMAYVSYLGKAIWPTHLAVFYQHPGNEFHLGETIAAAALLLALSTVVLFRPLRRGYLVVGWFWFCLTLGPVSGLVQVGLQGMADRYTYVPLVGLFVALAWGIGEVVERWKVARAWVLGLTAGCLVACLVLTYRQVGVWKDTQSLFEHAIAVTPTCDVGHANLALLHWGRGQHREAIEHLLQAHAERPQYASYSHKLGEWLLVVGRIDEGLASYAQALQAKGKNATPGEHLELGRTCWRFGRLNEAEKQFQLALTLQPDLVGAVNSLGAVFAQQGRPEEALACFDRALVLRPGFALARNNRGLTLVLLGSYREGTSELEKALGLDPKYHPAWNNLGNASAYRDEWKGAAANYRKAIELAPRSAVYHFNLAHALHQLGRRDEAGEEYREGLRLDKDWPEKAAREAWDLATNSEKALRHGRKAVMLALQSCQAAGEQPRFLDVLAAAYAEHGKFPDASAAARRALALAMDSGQRPLSGGIQERLRLYEAGRAFHRARR